jgi:two-component system chemotaxis sensor kinase CheA
LADRQPALLLAAGVRRIAFLVEAVGQEQEVLVKGLGPHLQGLPLLAGATVLGNGQVAPVLDSAELIRAAVRWSESAPAAEAAAAPGGAPARRRSILVAEDSITSRTLLKNILEAADFTVETAVDGVDAYTRLRGGEFDLVVSDVDMPRLNGLGLTAKIRADKRLAGLPVVLVTSLDSRADRERGIAVGANAYIVKRSFEQSNLLEVIRRLL